MALKQHTDISERFRQQYENAKEYLVPFLQQQHTIEAGMKVMEIGCGEGGVLKAFTDLDCFSLGVDLSESRIQRATEQMLGECEAGKAKFIAQNVYEDEFLEEWRGTFDWILLKDTIEHIPDQERFIPYLHHFLKSEGKIFFGFPPWYMPFGGHQQICKGKWLSKIPYYHLLPKTVYKAILKAGGEPEGVVQELMNIKDTGISLERFERIIRKSGFKIENRRIYLFNPIYKYKFGVKARVQFALIRGLPGIRNILSTAGWYIVGKAKPSN